MMYCPKGEYLCLMRNKYRSRFPEKINATVEMMGILFLVEDWYCKTKRGFVYGYLYCVWMYHSSKVQLKDYLERRLANFMYAYIIFVR